MRLVTLMKTHAILVAGAALLTSAVTVVAMSHGAARADGPTEAPFVTYRAPTGPEMSPSAVANTAIRYAREFGDDGEVTLELARGTLTQVKALMEGGSLATAQAQEGQLRSATPSSTFCFGGQNASCTATEVQHAKETLYEEGQTSTYLVAMSGKGFKPPERLPRGRSPIVADKVILLVDGHTGIQVGMTIGAGTSVPNLAELHAASRFVAAPQSTNARAAGATKPTHDRPRPRLVKPNHSHPKRNFGRIGG
jgi:hypothetical protein